MTYGGSLFLIAVGAILRYAVTAQVAGISLATVGLILMIIGVIGFVLSLMFMFMWRQNRQPVERVVERERYHDTAVRPY